VTLLSSTGAANAPTRRDASEKDRIHMRLAEFIANNMEVILAEWETFAASVRPAGANMTSLALRDHAPDILDAVVKDITTAQTREAQAEKSKGRAPRVLGSPATAAQTHALLRAQSGFDINQLVAEYRALRASVLRLWIDACPLDEASGEEIMRFDEAIDQAIAESVGDFHAQVERGRNLFLGMLGHDMRTPLNAIVATASLLTALNAGEQVSAAAGRLIRSGASMRLLLDDLVDFNRTHLGLGIKVVPADIDLAEELGGEVEQLRSVHPDRRIEFAVTGDAVEHCDGGRLKQVLRNLVTNAIVHGSPDTPVRVALVGEEQEIRLNVTNEGPAIDPSFQRELFDPLRRGIAQTNSHEYNDGLGLGLFIVRALVLAHGGRVEVRSDSTEGETTFTVVLPRQKSVTSR
jgi:signal transduction histidine kinase